MRNLTSVAKKSETNRRLPLYYSFKTDSVYTEGGEDRFFVTYLINPNTTEDIRKTVLRWKML